MSSFSIAIDGPAGSGKSVIARELARRLDMLYLDTGAMYRAVALAALRAGVTVSDTERVAAIARALRMAFVAAPEREEGYRLLADDADVTDSLHTPEVDAVVGLVAAQKAVREVLSAQQRALGLRGGVIMVGRDIATVVLPEARIKLFLTASLEERAVRRLRDLQAKHEAVNYDTVLAQMQTRDALDTQRETAPLRAAEGSLVVDTTGRTVAETLDAIVAQIGARS
ncbi:MAG: (d)CMP kinase [Candidatus Xenobia bacterium]